jgi:predicted permease
VGTFSNQLKHVLRRLMHSPMFTIVTLLTIGLGVGANTAIFSLINGILLKPLSYPEPERLVSVWQTAPTIGIVNCNLSPSDYFTFREENRSFQEFGIWTGDSSSVTGMGMPEQVQGILVTEGTLRALGVQPAQGRGFSASDDSPGSPRTVLLSYGYWQHRFGGEASAIGKQLQIDGRPTEIIGVMPQSFRFLDQRPDLIAPFRFDRAKTTLGNFSYQGIARLRQGVTLAQANADVARMIPIVNTKFPPPPGFSVKLFEEAHIQPSVRPLKQDVIGDLGKVLWVLMGSIAVVLLIACANVANLLLVRAEGRQQELAIRTALGAGSGRIAGELLMESVLLGLLGGAAGLALAYGLLRLLVAIGPKYLPRLDNVSLDPLSLVFTLAISLLAGMLFGLIPVLKYSRQGITMALRAGGRTLSQSKERHQARNSLVVLQTALALVLLIGSGLMIRAFQALRHVQPGFDAAGLQTFRIYVPESHVKEPEQVVRMFQDLQRRISSIPRVSSVAFGNSIPTDGHDATDLLYAEGRAYREGQLPPLRRFKFVTPGYFRTMGTRLIGRDLTWEDVYEKRTVALVSENTARELWGGPAGALGKRIREGMKDSWREIVGVVADVRHDGADHQAPSTTYWPLMLSDFWGNKTFLQRGVVYAVRGDRAGSESLLKEIRHSTPISPSTRFAPWRRSTMGRWRGARLLW